MIPRGRAAVARGRLDVPLVFFIVASTRLLLFIVLLLLLSVCSVRLGSMFSFEGDLGNGLFGEPFAFVAVTGALL